MHLGKPTVPRESFLVQLVVIAATERPINVLHGNSARFWRQLLAAPIRDGLADLDQAEWSRRLTGTPTTVEGAATRLASLFGLLKARNDYPKLDKMRSWGRHYFERLFHDIGADRRLAWLVMATALDRAVLPHGGPAGVVFERLGFATSKDGSPHARAVAPETVSRLKRLLPVLGAAMCVHVEKPGAKECGNCPVQNFCLARRAGAKAEAAHAKGPTFVDAFAGGGGLSKGLQQAGFLLKSAIELDEYAADTLYANHPECESIQRRDIRLVLNDEGFIRANKGIDVVAGGPPCQPFSMARRHSGADKTDERRDLFRPFVRLVKKLQPKIVVMENVQGILTAAEGAVVKAIRRQYGAIDYTVKSVTLNAKNFGVPQERRRVFFIAARNSAFGDPAAVVERITKALAEEELDHPITLRQALSGLPRLRPGEGAHVMTNKTRGPVSAYASAVATRFRVVYNHIARPHNADDLYIYKDMKPGETARRYADRVKNHRIKYSLDHFGDKYRKLHLGKPAPTIPAHLRRDANSFINPLTNIGITGREAARIQGFPDDYMFMGGFGPTFIQVGNAIPPPMAKGVGMAVRKELT